MPEIINSYYNLSIPAHKGGNVFRICLFLWLIETEPMIQQTKQRCTFSAADLHVLDKGQTD